jgi:hypothetical protein
MKTQTRSIIVFWISLLLITACNLPRLQQEVAPTPSSTSSPIITNTSAQQATFSETPSVTPVIAPTTPPPAITVVIVAGDLGKGSIHGKVIDSTTGAPIAGAKVTCQHSSYTSTTLCNTSVVTAQDGTYVFPESFFHDTDRVQLEVQAQGYVTQTLKVNFLVSPWLNEDFALAPVVVTNPPQIMCTQPACRPYEALFCPQGNCPGGCGYVCATPAAICTPPLCAIGTSEVYTCKSGVCPGGCGTTCATFTPAP